MANAYLVPGGNGNINSSTNWSTTSGGASGYTPVAGDDLIADANSMNTPLITISGTTYESLQFSNYTGNLTLTTGTQTFRSGLIYSTGMTTSGTGAVTVGGIGMSTAFVNFNGVTHSGAFSFSNSTQLQTIYTVTGDLNIIGTVAFANSNGAGQGVKIIVNGGRILCNSGFSIFGNGNRFLSGTSEIWFVGTGSGNVVSGTSSRMINITLVLAKTGGALTMTTGSLSTNNTTINYVSGTYINFSVIPSSGGAIFNTAGMTWSFITITGGATITNNTLLNTLSLSINAATSLQGTGDIVTNTLTNVASFQLNSAKTLFINSSWSSVATSAIPFVIYSSAVGVQAKIILASNATQDIAHTNARDIDSSGGKTIYSYRVASLTNTINWATLPIITSVNTKSIIQ